jgi:hypothetical protein
MEYCSSSLMTTAYWCSGSVMPTTSLRSSGRRTGLGRGDEHLARRCERTASVRDQHVVQEQHVALPPATLTISCRYASPHGGEVLVGDRRAIAAPGVARLAVRRTSPAPQGGTVHLPAARQRQPREGDQRGRDHVGRVPGMLRTYSRIAAVVDVRVVRNLPGHGVRLLVAGCWAIRILVGAAAVGADAPRGACTGWFVVDGPGAPRRFGHPRHGDRQPSSVDVGGEREPA